LGSRKVIVLDTNILVSAAGWFGPEHRLVKKCQGGDLQLGISYDLLAELERVLRYPRLDFDESLVLSTIAELLQHAVLVETEDRLDIIADDPDDNRALECAVAASAALIVSGDRHLLSLGSFNDIQILTTSEALRLLDSESS
jgi:uncharacterized protein